MDIQEIEKYNPTGWCEGIIGDGCGGGRIFFTTQDTIKVFDPVSKEVSTLIQGLSSPKNIAKDGCNLFFNCKEKKMTFDLSQMRLV